MRSLGLAALATASLSVQAMQLAKVVPEGEVGQLTNVVVQFTESVKPLGDLRGEAPVTVRCTPEGASEGTGRWTNDKEWVFDFKRPLPSGARCQVQANDNFVPGVPGVSPTWTGKRDFKFFISAPTVQRTIPWEGSQIEEEQHILLQLSAPVREESVAKGLWCESNALGERIPVVLSSPAERQAALKSQRVIARNETWIMVGCQRPLPAGSEVSLVWGPNIASMADTTVTTRGERRFKFTVRQPLTAEFTCERERANAPCVPILPIHVDFSEPVPKAQARAVRLRGPDNKLYEPISRKDSGVDEEDAGTLRRVTFPSPLPESTTFKLEMPKGTKDVSGRPLSNAASFPMVIQTGAAPPLAKFAAAPFGIVEWERQEPSLVPLTMRHVQPELQPGGPGKVLIKRVTDDLEVLRWFGKVRKASNDEWKSREVPMLQGDANAQSLTLPKSSTPATEMEVVGVPLRQPGYHVLEVASPRLGNSLLDPPATMYVRTGVLVTNLGIHFKLGRDNSMAWVTTLDSGRPAPNAKVAVYDCAGRSLWTGKTDESGVAHIDRPSLSQRTERECVAEYGLYVTARLEQSGQPEDFTFLFSNWSRGIEPWRFNLPTAYGASDTPARAATITDRPLLRPGDVLSMKHFFRLETLQGLSDAPPDQLPTQLRIIFEATGEEVFKQALTWQSTRYALSTWQVPPGAKLGSYRLVLQRQGDGPQGQRQWDTGGVKVDEIRVPLVDARLLPPKSTAAGAKEFQWGAQLNYMAGGPMAQAPVQISAVLQPRWTSYPAYTDFAFDPPEDRDPNAAVHPDDAERGEDGDDDAGGGTSADRQLLVDKLAVQTDKQGAAQFRVPLRQPVTRPSELRVELSYRDPDGQTHTRSASQVIWPAEVQVGLRAPTWVANGQQLPVQAVVLDTSGKPLAGRVVTLTARQIQTLSTRKRLVGGFYAYEQKRQVKELGELCRATSDAQGLARCDLRVEQSGQVEIIATTLDAGHHSAKAARAVWVTRAGEFWFAQENDDRIDVIADRRHWEPGETARFQVRMPYRDATALITVEREGLLYSRVQRLSGRDPWVEVKIDKDWAPNAFVGVTVVRGRLKDVPWYSFFTWGWREPGNWWRAWRASSDYQPPTAMVDLAKPSFKMGIAGIEIGRAKHDLKVEVLPQQAQYGVRQSAQVRVRVTQDGRPVPDAQLAFAAVDEGLLSLSPNGSWRLLNHLLQDRPWAVSTATAHSEIIGRRHYGRKAAAAGGGGGFATRELFDTLLTWQPAVALNAQGEAVVTVPLNDSLTRFRLVAIADAPGQRFGTGENSITVGQDLQLLSGLPPLAREGDRMEAMLTVRNTTNRAMTLSLLLKGVASIEGTTDQPIPAQTRQLTLAAGGAEVVSWSVVVPDGAQRINWEAQAVEQGSGGAKDAMKVTQQVQPAVPLRVLQATLRQLDAPLSLPVSAPADALPMQGVKRGGIQVGLQPRLSSALPGIRRFFATYPYNCLEQQASKYVALHDDAAWTTLMGQLSSYQDRDGLFGYYPLSAGYNQGSDVLTAYLLSMAKEAGRSLPDAAQTRALDGLAAFVEGRIARTHWSPRPDDEPRRVSAIAALARHGRATARQLATVDAAHLPTWPTAAVIDWLVIQQRLPASPQRDAQLAAAQTQLRARLSYAGTTLRFVSEDTDAWWWLMDSGDSNASRLLLAVVNDPAWREEIPRIVTGALARQERGAWYNTTANLWGALALERFGTVFESKAVSGKTEASLGTAKALLDWSAQPQGGSLALPWPSGGTGTVAVHQAGDGRPWVTMQSLAAVPLKSALSAGYSVKRSITAVSQKAAPAFTRGDVLRVRLEVDAAADMSWVVISDPLPTGAAVVSGTLDAEGERNEGEAWPSYIERSFAAWRAYFAYLPKGRHVYEYTVRLNNAGRFQMPSTRVEAMYAPDRFGEAPNATMEVAP
ncbi:MG2 domain-containing protein [Roseateles sp. SL47]|uniref:alpha-2-macroglobulin family protein n=1 Tax=Roseateles sp. SL47 TaxID=2995138 RepID=UPI0022710CE8|nr:MG2 domain-containing protein [Roseateles sp. SL47]WAC72589.1 MG2 domain-containing protein [Roseateles sp. SL47]